MKKLLWLLFMPFFIACSSKKQPQPDNIVVELKRLLAAASTTNNKTIRPRYIDSLITLGARYTWTKNADIADTGFRSYILLNAKIGDSIWEWTKAKGAASFLKNVIKYEKVLQKDSMPYFFTNALYKLTDRDFRYVYNEDIVQRLEKCLAYHRKKSALKSHHYFSLLQSLSIAYHVLGEKELAKRYYDEVLRLALLMRPNKIASASINLYSYFTEYGQYDSVINNVPTILALPEIDGAKVATIKTYLAEALYAKGNPTYKQQLNDAWAALQDIPYKKMGGDEWGKKTDVLKLYGEIALQEKEYNAAKVFFRKALDTCWKKNVANDDNPLDRSYAKLLLKLASVYDSTRQYDSALYYNQFALYCVTAVDSCNIAINPTLKDLYTENTIMEALDSKANLLEKKHSVTKDMGLLQNAVTCYQLAFTVEQKLLVNFTYDSSRAKRQQVSKARSGRAINTCYQLYQLTGNTNWAEKAFQFSENSKALILLEAIKKNIYSGRYKDNPLFKTVDSLQLQLVYAEGRILIDTAIDATDRKRRLENELANALTALDNSEFSYKNYRQQQDTALLLNVRQNLLTNNRHLAEFFCMGNDRYLFVVKKSGALVFSKLDTGVNQQVELLMDYYTANNDMQPNQYQEIAYQLYQATGLSAALPADELLLIPDGPFNEVPFDALVTNNTGDKGFAKMDYLLKQVTTSYGYSAASLLKQLNNPITTAAQIAAFAPGFAKGERNLAPLPNSKIEVKNIGATFTYIDTQATIAKLQQGLKQASIIHIASHASPDTGAKANPRVEMYDGPYYMSELYATPLPKTNLVVLSACQTNQGNIDQSEGTLSLARGFYYAGAKNIVASLWKVDDQSTADIVQQFYGNGNGSHYAAKLRSAKEWYLSNKQTGGKTAPYYWAAMMHIGGFSKDADTSNWLGYSIGIGATILLLLVGGVFYWQRRKR